MENQYWKKTVGTLISSIWLYTLAGIAVSLLGVIQSLLSPLNFMQTMQSMNNNNTMGHIIDTMDIMKCMLSAGILMGYYLFFRSITRFAQLQTAEQDKTAVSSVRMSYILMVVAIFAFYLPLIGGLAKFVLTIVAYIKLLIGYYRLKHSNTFPGEAGKGAGTLFACTIWILVGNILGHLPIIGSPIEGIITLITFFSILSAWKRIRDAAPELTQEETATLAQNEPPANKQSWGDWLTFYLCANSIFGIFFYILTDSYFQYEYGFELDSSLYIFIVAIWLLVFSVLLTQAFRLCKKRWTATTKIGSSLMLAGLLLSLFSYVFLNIERVTMGWCILLSDICSGIGFLFLIWKSTFSLWIKRTATAYMCLPILYCFPAIGHSYFAMTSIHLRIFPDNLPLAQEAFFGDPLLSLCLQITLAGLILYLITLWQKQPEKPVTPDSHATTGITAFTYKQTLCNGLIIYFLIYIIKIFSPIVLPDYFVNYSHAYN